jgi:hypothetical protein
VREAASDIASRQSRRRCALRACRACGARHALQRSARGFDTVPPRFQSMQRTVRFASLADLRAAGLVTAIKGRSAPTPAPSSSCSSPESLPAFGDDRGHRQTEPSTLRRGGGPPRSDGASTPSGSPRSGHGWAARVPWLLPRQRRAVCDATRRSQRTDAVPGSSPGSPTSPKRTREAARRPWRPSEDRFSAPEDGGDRPLDFGHPPGLESPACRRWSSTA